MLVITRRENEEVVIGDPNNPIGVVRIASIKGDRVRIAFDFPRSIDVHRREVANQIMEEQPHVIATLNKDRRDVPASVTDDRSQIVAAINKNGVAQQG